MPATGDAAGTGNPVSANDLSIIPNRYGPIVILPENIVMGIVVKVADTNNVPAARHHASTGNNMGSRDLAVVNVNAAILDGPVTDCENGAAIVFTGPANSVAVPWQCIPQIG